MTNKLTPATLSTIGNGLGAKLARLTGETPSAYVLLAYCPVGGDDYVPLLTSNLPPETQLVALEEICGQLRAKLGRTS